MAIGLEDWFLNFTHLASAAITPQGLANVPRPYTEIAIFGALKGAEITSFIGGCIVHPIYRFYLKKRLTPETTTNNSLKIIRSTCRRVQGRFLIGGLVAGPIIALTYAAGCSEAELKEKCYQIRIDEPVMVLDRLTLTFGFIGWYWKRFQGAVDGINLAIAYSVLYNGVLRKHTSPLLLDKVKPHERLPSVKESEARRSVFSYFMAKRPAPLQGTEDDN